MCRRRPTSAVASARNAERRVRVEINSSSAFAFESPKSSRVWFACKFARGRQVAMGFTCKQCCCCCCLHKGEHACMQSLGPQTPTGLRSADPSTSPHSAARNRRRGASVLGGARLRAPSASVQLEPNQSCCGLAMLACPSGSARLVCSLAPVELHPATAGCS